MGDDDLKKAVRQAIQAHGAAPVARALGLSAEATCRIGGGLPTQKGTLAQARANVDKLSAIPPKSA